MKLPQIIMKSVDKVKRDPNNPRIIKDAKFKELCRSIEGFPKMMALRPIVINKAGMIKGGDKRFVACVELGWKEVPCILAEDLTSEEQRQFVMKDNLSYGEWDFENMSDHYEAILIDFGFDIPQEKKKAAKVSGNRELTFRYSEKEYLKILSMLEEAMTVDGFDSREKYLKHILSNK